jgi:hypothetical protein
MKRKPVPYEENHKEIDGIVFKKCRICEEWFPCNTKYFYKNNSSKKDGISPYCKTCEKEQAKQWTKANYDKHPIYMKRDYEKRKDKYIESANKQREKGNQKIWRQNNPEKLKGYNDRYSNKKHKIYKKEWDSCKEYFNYECAYCGMLESEHKKVYNQQFHKEHVNCNGSDDLGNCLPSCKRCNTSKHQSDMEEWYRKQDFFKEERLNKIYKWVNKDHEQYIQEHKLRKEYTKKDITYWNNEDNTARA